MPDLNNNNLKKVYISVLLENLLVCQANYLAPLLQYIKFCINKALGILICRYATPWETEHLLNNKLPGNRTSEVPTSQAPFLSWCTYAWFPPVHTVHPARGRKNELSNKQLE